MSRENVEVVRQVIEWTHSDDLDRMDRGLALWDPNCEFTPVMAEVEPQTYRGHDGLRRYFSELADSWRDWRMEVEEILDAGPETVIAVFRTYLVGKDSGAAVEAQRGMVCVLSEGKLLRARVYPSREEALEAVGLRE